MAGMVYAGAMWRIPFLLALLPACDQATVERIRDRRDQAALATAAEQYWLALRWNDAGRAGLYHGTSDARLALVTGLSAGGWRITEATVLQVTVDPVPDAPAPGWLRPGTAIVRVEALDNLRNKVVTETVEQHWEQTGSGWKVDDDRSAPDPARGW